MVLSGRPPLRAFARRVLYCLLLFPILCVAQVNALPNTDKRVAVYRALEKQFISAFGEARAPWPLCRAATSEFFGRSVPLVRTQDGRFKRLSISHCVLEIATGCQQGMFPITEVETDGRWAWTKSRIGFVSYLRVLARTSGVPEAALTPEFNAMENLILENIKRRLDRPIRLQVYEFDIGMGVSNDVRYAQERSEALEEAFAARWNTYVLSLPINKQSDIPFLEGEAEGCGAGETTYEIASNPPGGRIRVISEMDAMLCEAFKDDPWDPDRCQGWSSIASPEVGLVGAYRYVVEWTNRPAVRDRIEVDQQRSRKLCVPTPCDKK